MNLNIRSNAQHHMACDLCGHVQYYSDLDVPVGEEPNPEGFFVAQGWTEDSGWTCCPVCSAGEKREDLE